MGDEVTRIERCPTVLLLDAPADEDAFGAHKDIAEAIHDLVESEGSGLAIGLSGGYGSGKSTVIKLLTARYAAKATRQVWLFDAWAHEGDPLRRTFLESLIGQFVGVGWLDEDRWKRRLMYLSRRRKAWRTKSTPSVTRFGMLFAVSLLFVPFGGIMAGAALVSGHSYSLDVSRPFSLFLATATLFAFAPLLLALGRGALWKLRGGQTGSELTDIFALLTQKDTSQTATRSVETPEPTSLEFASVFGDLMQEALGDCRDRRVVLVIDNLDRAAAPAALELWATLQTFLSSTGRQAWRDRVTAIIPYDESAIKRLWNPLERSALAQQTFGVTPALASEVRPAPGMPVDGLAQAFLEKTFRIRFDVPPPVLTDRKEYALTLLARALPRHASDQGEFRDVFAVYEQMKRASDKTTLPRDLIVFVNQLGALHRQRKEEDISLVTLAYYVLLRETRTTDEIVAGLLVSILPQAETRELLGATAREDLAALAFGVDRDRGRQLLLREPMELALRSGDDKRLAEIAHEGFWDELEQSLPVFLDRWSQEEKEVIYQAARALAAGRLIAGAPQPVAANLTGKISGKIIAQAGTKKVSAASVPGMAAWLEIDAVACADAILGDFTRVIQAVLNDGGEDRHRAAAALLLQVIPRVPEAHPNVSVAVESADDVVDIIRELGSGHEDDCVVACLSASSTTELVESLEARIQRGACDMGTARAVLGCLETDRQGNVRSAVVRRISEAGDLVEAEVAPLLRLVRLLPSRDDTLSELARSGGLARLYGAVSAAGMTDARGLLLAAYVRECRDLEQPGRDERSSDGYDRLQGSLAVPVSARDEGVIQELRTTPDALLDLWSAESARDFVRSVVDVWAKEEYAALVFTPERVISHWRVFGERASFADNIVQRLRLGARLAELLEDSAVDFSRPLLYEVIFRGRQEYQQQQVSFERLERNISTALRACTESEWLAALQSDEPRDLVRFADRVRKVVDISVGHEARAALQVYGDQLVSGAESGLGLKNSQYVRGIVGHLDNGERALLAEHLLDRMKLDGASASAAFFACFGPALAWHISSLSTHPAVAVMLPRLIEIGGADALVWTSTIFRDYPDWWPSLREDYRSGISTAIGTRWESASEADAAVRESIKLIASAVDVVLPPTDPE